MISVRKEWKECKSDEELLEWTKKWGSLLMETWNNPIFVAGHTEGKKSVLHQLDQVAAGEYPDNPPDQVLNYAEALQLISQNLKVLSFTLKSEKDFSIDTPTLKKLAADEMAKKLVDFVDIDVETTDTEKHYHFNLVMVE